jgi:hypothetical protein
MKGLEPPRLSAPDPKSGAATNYATSALIVPPKLVCKYTTFYLKLPCLLHNRYFFVFFCFSPPSKSLRQFSFINFAKKPQNAEN